MAGDKKRITVPFGDVMTPEQRVLRVLQIIADLYPLSLLSQEEFVQEDNREEAAAYSAAVGRCVSKLPADFREKHREVDWKEVEDLRYTAYHDKIDVLILHDRLQDLLPGLREHLQKIIDAAEADGRP